MRDRELDAFDLKILAAVQRDNLQPHRRIAEAVALSVPAVARRLQRLRDEGVIRADVAIVDHRAVGRALQVIVEVCVESELPARLDATRQRFLDCPHVQQCYYTTGEVDFVLVLAVRDMAEYTHLTQTLFREGQNVRSFRSFVALERVKDSTALVLDAP